jgi:hypothetical protein
MPLRREKTGFWRRSHPQPHAKNPQISWGSTSPIRLERKVGWWSLEQRSKPGTNPLWAPELPKRSFDPPGRCRQCQHRDDDPLHDRRHADLRPRDEWHCVRVCPCPSDDRVAVFGPSGIGDAKGQHARANRPGTFSGPACPPGEREPGNQHRSGDCKIAADAMKSGKGNLLWWCFVPQCEQWQLHHFPNGVTQQAHEKIETNGRHPGVVTHPRWGPAHG